MSNRYEYNINVEKLTGDLNGIKVNFLPSNIELVERWSGEPQNESSKYIHFIKHTVGGENYLENHKEEILNNDLILNKDRVLETQPDPENRLLPGLYKPDDYRRKAEDAANKGVKNLYKTYIESVETFKRSVGLFGVSYKSSFGFKANVKSTFCTEYVEKNPFIKFEVSGNGGNSYYDATVVVYIRDVTGEPVIITYYELNGNIDKLYNRVYRDFFECLPDRETVKDSYVSYYVRYKDIENNRIVDKIKDFTYDTCKEEHKSCWELSMKFFDSTKSSYRLIEKKPNGEECVKKSRDELKALDALQASQIENTLEALDYLSRNNVD